MACELNNIYDICVLQNQTFELPFQLYKDDGITPINISGWSFTGSIKSQFTDFVPALFFTASVINASSGSVKLYLGADTTWILTGSKYVYDVIGNNTNVVPVETLRLMQGKVSVRPGVTEPGLFVYQDLHLVVP
jgi:hypothetical protein